MSMLLFMYFFPNFISPPSHFSYSIGCHLHSQFDRNVRQWWKTTRNYSQQHEICEIYENSLEMMLTTGRSFFIFFHNRCECWPLLIRIKQFIKQLFNCCIKKPYSRTQWKQKKQFHLSSRFHIIKIHLFQIRYNELIFKFISYHSLYKYLLVFFLSQALDGRIQFFVHVSVQINDVGNWKQSLVAIE